ncbi:MAG: nucleotide-binding protein [Nanoarchaeota archaeon]|nr:nucleotide-binding protein [Nanoarchaeota archaeon]
MIKIILDTNFVLIPFQFHIDIFSEIQRIADFKYQLCVLDKTIDELKKIIKEQKGKHKAAAKLALQLIKKKKVKTLKTTEDKYVDDLLVEQSKKGALIATQDIGLKKRLKKPYIILRQKKYLTLT